MAEFEHADLTGSRFADVTLTGATFTDVNLTGARFRDVDLSGAKLSGVDLVDVTIGGHVQNLVVNGVDVAPLIAAELDRRHPERATMRPTDPAGFREAWDVLERLWAGTIERARRLPPSSLHESVDGEWSFVETLRHLVFATEVWVLRAILGDPAPWHPLSLPFDGMPDTPSVPRDRTARPTLDEILAVRHSRTATVREVIDGLTDSSLAAVTTPVDAPGWPPAKPFPVHRCLSIVLNEEWEHRLYAERDLAVLETSATPSAPSAVR